MLEVSELASTKLKAYLDENNIDSAIRVAVMQGGWAGPSLGLALDEPKDGDSTYDLGGIQFVLDPDLGDKCGSIKIDFIEAGPRSGFAISPTKPLNLGGGCGSSCGSGGGSGSCGC